jgi:hypothetical protein
LVTLKFQLLFNKPASDIRFLSHFVLLHKSDLGFQQTSLMFVT